MEQVYPPPTLEAVQRGCPWVDEMVKTGGAGYRYPLWFLSMLLATFIEGGEQVAHKFSEGYKGYDEEKTDTKYAEVKQSREANGIGWPLCATIAAAAKTGECSKACEGCPKLASGKTPLHWADTSIEPTALGATDPAGHVVTGLVGGPPVPTGLARTAEYSPRAVPISKLPLVPPKRQWLRGVDLIRGAVSMLVAPGGRAK
jgi:hypothetical protein